MVKHNDLNIEHKMFNITRNYDYMSISCVQRRSVSMFCCFNQGIGEVPPKSRGENLSLSLSLSLPLWKIRISIYSYIYIYIYIDMFLLGKAPRGKSRRSPRTSPMDNNNNNTSNNNNNNHHNNHNNSSNNDNDNNDIDTSFTANPRLLVYRQSSKTSLLPDISTGDSTFTGHLHRAPGHLHWRFIHSESQTTRGLTELENVFTAAWSAVDS